MDIVALVILFVVAIIVAKGVRVVPQQNAWVVERLGKYHGTLLPGCESGHSVYRQYCL